MPLPSIQFNELPESVREWLTGDEATEILTTLSGELEAMDELEYVLPKLVTRVVTRRLPLERLVFEIQNGLGTDFNAATQAYQTIVARILKPVAKELESVGIAVSATPLPEALTPATKTTAPLNAPQDLAMPQVSSEQLAPNTPPLSTTTSDTRQAIRPEPVHEAPFILHEEVAPTTPVSGGGKGPSFSFKIRKTFSEVEPTKKPVTVRIETPRKEEKSAQGERVVHYSSLTTELGPDGNPK